MILTTIAIVAQAAPSATASPAATATPDIAKITDRAKAWYVALSHGKILDKAQLADDMAKLLTADTLQKLAGVQGAGDPVKFDLVRSGSQAGNDLYLFDVTTSSGMHIMEMIAFDTSSGKVSGFQMTPKQ